MKRSWKVLIPLLLVLSLVLVACGGNDKPVDEDVDVDENVDEDVDVDDEEEEEEDVSSGEIELPHPSIIQKDGETVGGTLNMALVTSTPFEGFFNKFLSKNAVDTDLMAPIYGTFTKAGKDFEIVDGGYANVEFDKDAKTATYKIHPDLTWSDGVPVTARDLAFTYECIAHKDYTGVRFDSDYRNVVGIEEYHEGEADTISGLKEIDDKTLEVSFKEFYPGILWGAGLAFNPEPAHYLEDVPLADMESSDKIRKNPVSCGPFMVSNIVEGESVEYVPNPHWFGEEPKVDKIVYKRTNPDTTVEALKAGNFDVVKGLKADSYDDYVALDNIEMLSSIERSYNYIGFKLGEWDSDKLEVEMDPDAKMADVELRKAMAYAMNNEEIAEVFYSGLRMPANTLIDPAHGTFWNSEQEGYEYNPDKANEILDAAGYIDVDGDGFREDPDGNKLEINFLSMSGGEIAEPLAQYYIQNWQDVGLNVDLLNGRLIEMNAFYDMIEEDNPDIDVFMGAWSTGSNPDPSGLYGKDAQYNFPRFRTEEHDQLLANIASEEALDEDYMLNAYHEWQEYMVEQVPVAPTHYRVELVGVNKRVNYWDETVGSDWGWEKVGLLEENPVK